MKPKHTCSTLKVTIPGNNRRVLEDVLADTIAKDQWHDLRDTETRSCLDKYVCGRKRPRWTYRVAVVISWYPTTFPNTSQKSIDGTELFWNVYHRLGP